MTCTGKLTTVYATNLQGLENGLMGLMRKWEEIPEFTRGLELPEWAEGCEEAHGIDPTALFGPVQFRNGA